MYTSAKNKKYSIHSHITDSELEIISAGHLAPGIAVPHERPVGYPNYLLIFIKSGKGIFKFGEKEIAANTNSIVIYRPNQPQYFTYLKEGSPHIYWIHFAGTRSDEIMQHFKLKDIQTTTLQKNDISKLIENIVFEINKDKTFSNELAKSILLQILATVAQEITSEVSTLEIEKILNLMREDYANDLPISFYASKCGMSESHFLRRFKDKTGTTPHHFKLILRIDMAKEMLLDTTVPINSISSIVGFKDQFHFSRYFKKSTGYSPREYRANKNL